MKIKINTITKSLLADMQTPVSIYLKIRDLYAESALLESSDYHSSENSYSFVGVNPISFFKLEDEKVIKQYPSGETVQLPLDENNTLVNSFQQFINEFDIQGDNPTGTNGLFGYTSYDAIHYFENIDAKYSMQNKPEVPTFYYILYRYIIVINHLKNELTIVENIPEDEVSKMNDLEMVLANNNIATYQFETIGEEQSNRTDEEHIAMIEKGIEYCKSGELGQIVISRSFKQEFRGDEFNAYRALRSINPSPYLFYFDFGSYRVFGSSPETHLKISKSRAYIDPIAGTYFRTGDDDKDQVLSENLLKDQKELNEHDMLVDLAKNDLNKNCTNVKVEFYKNVQFYSHVIHLVSRVSGVVKDNVSPVKLYADTFPAGTLTGAPKVHALELIRDIEQSPRGVYGGCIGYVGFNGDLNQAITIRTFMSKNNMLYYQAGGGIVAESKPANEVQEVKSKLGALKKALDMATQIKN